jgi:ribosomal-protein-alanine acetyltransferase
MKPRTTISVETASIRYLQELYEVESRCFDEEAFTKDQIAALLTDYNSVSLIALTSDVIMGFIIGSAYFERNSLVGHVLTIDVLPDQRRKGIGTLLLQELEKLFKAKGAHACTLEVREDNVAAIGLYRKLGYKTISNLRNYYGSIHGIRLRKILL